MLLNETAKELAWQAYLFGCQQPRDVTRPDTPEVFEKWYEKNTIQHDFFAYNKSWVKPRCKVCHQFEEYHPLKCSGE